MACEDVAAKGGQGVFESLCRFTSSALQQQGSQSSGESVRRISKQNPLRCLRSNHSTYPLRPPVLYPAFTSKGVCETENSLKYREWLAFCAFSRRNTGQIQIQFDS